MILYFSGTGNSRHCAEVIAEINEDNVEDMAEHIRLGTFGAYTSEKPYVFVGPVYAGRFPRVMMNFLMHSVFNGTKDVYFVATCAGDPWNTEKYVRKQFAFKHMEIKGFARVIMPSSFNTAAQTKDVKDCEDVLSAADTEIRKIAEEIKEGKTLAAMPHKNGMMSSLANPLMYKFMMGTGSFKVSDACVGCGKCAAVCPLGTIHLNAERHPEWGRDCTMCGGCIGVCPEKAIDYGTKTKGKPRYYYQ